MENEPRMKLHMQIAANVLEVEGPVAEVAAMLAEWKRLTGLAPAAALQASTGGQGPAAAGASAPGAQTDPAIAALFQVDAQKQLLTLCTAPRGKRRNAEAALLLLYGYALHNGNGVDGIRGPQLLAALRASGLRFKRLDRVVARSIAEGLMRRHGIHLQERYALTDRGCKRAAKLAVAFTEKDEPDE